MSEKNKDYISVLKPHLKYYRENAVREINAEQTLYRLIKDINQNNLDYNAIGYMNHDYTYDNMLKDVDKLALSFKEIGIKENDVVTIGLVSTPEVAKVLLALNKIGAVSKWIDIRVKKKEDLEHYINEHESKYIIIFDMLLPLVEETINNTELKKVIVSTPADSLSLPEKLGYTLKSKLEGTYNKLPNDNRFIYFNDLLKQKSNSILEISKYDKEKPSLIVQSSGTTGMAKSIVHTDFTVNESINKFSYSDLPLEEKNRLLVTVPPWVAYGLINSYYLSLAFGMQAVLCPKVDKDTVFNALGKFDLSFAAPLHYRYLVEKIENCKDLTELKALITGGDKITVEELKSIKEVLSIKGFNGQIINGYGNNEGLGAETVNPMKYNKLGTVGIPMYGNIVAAFDENNQELKINESGEICVKTSTMFKEYSNNKEETDKIKQLHDDGEYWIHTGDIGKVDEEGFVHIEGRLRRVIIRKAFKIFPGTIEKTIKSHYSVKDCITVGVHSKEEISVPMAHIVLKDQYLSDTDKMLKEIKSLCESELKDYETPAYYNIIDDIPYTQNNKQDFRKLEDIGNDIISNQKSKKLTK